MAASKGTINGSKNKVLVCSTLILIIFVGSLTFYSDVFHLKNRDSSKKSTTWTDLSVLEQTLRNGNYEVKRSGSVKDCDLDPKSDILVIIDPEEDYDDGEIAVIDNFLTQGGPVLVSISHPNYDPRYFPRENKLLNEFGLERINGPLIFRNYYQNLSLVRYNGTFLNKTYSLLIQNVSTFRSYQDYGYITRFQMNPLFTFKETGFVDQDNDRFIGPSFDYIVPNPVFFYRSKVDTKNFALLAMSSIFTDSMINQMDNKGFIMALLRDLNPAAKRIVLDESKHFTTKSVYIPFQQLKKDAPIEFSDCDEDGLCDLEETYVYGTSNGSPDTDSDGLPDKWEIDYKTNPFEDDADIDPDHDGYTNLQEYQASTDPNDGTSHP